MSDPVPDRNVIVDSNLEASPEAVVWLSGRHPTWPPECACCLGPADTSKSFARFDGRDITPFPVCGLCRRHALASDVIASLALIGAFVVVGGGYYALFGTAVLKRALWLTGVVLLFAVAGVGFGLHMLLNRVLLVTTPACASGESPVARLAEPINESAEKAGHETDGSYAERRRCVKHLERARAAGEGYRQLSFTNRDYASRFVQANGESRGSPAGSA